MIFVGRGLPRLRRGATSSPVRWMCTDANTLPLYKRLSALGGGRGGSSVKLTMNKWLREGRSVKAVEVARYAKRLCKYGRFKHALQVAVAVAVAINRDHHLMEWMDTRGMNMSYHNYALRMQLISKVAGVELAEKYFNDLPEAAKNRLSYGALMNIYCAEKMTDKAVSLFEVLKDLGYDSDTLVYNNMMSLFVKIGRLNGVLPLLEEMKQKKIRLDSFTYSTLVTYYATLRDIEAVDRTMQELETEHPSCQRWPTYSNLASVYMSAGCMEKAKFSLRRLERSMDCMDRAAYHHLISLYGRIGDSVEVKRMWTSLRASLKATNMSYLVFFQSLDKLDDFDALVQCFYEWDSNYETYDMRLVNVMIGAYLRKGRIQEATSLLESATTKGAEPDWRTFKLFIDYHATNGDFESAVGCFETAAAKLHALKLDKSTVGSILQYLEEKDMSQAKAFCQRVKELNCVELQHQTLTTVSMEGLDEQSLLMEGEIGVNT